MGGTQRCDAGEEDPRVYQASHVVPLDVGLLDDNGAFEHGAQRRVLVVATQHVPGRGCFPGGLGRVRVGKVLLDLLGAGHVLKDLGADILAQLLVLLVCHARPPVSCPTAKRTGRARPPVPGAHISAR